MTLLCLRDSGPLERTLDDRFWTCGSCAENYAAELVASADMSRWEGLRLRRSYFDSESGWRYNLHLDDHPLSVSIDFIGGES